MILVRYHIGGYTVRGFVKEFHRWELYNDEGHTPEFTVFLFGISYGSLFMQ